ncbi:transcription factor bHLH143-like [Diospyros lotus]|uniref:transcription factor bHLH143-like n=1 Tax=Diospyros lotus TaxID=55363 RepID=UPI00224F950C|nr:transcription factor bHLH143-like [Diospyros lotus]
MVKAEASWLLQQSSACDLANLNCTSRLLQHGQQSVLPSPTNHCMVSTDVTFPGFGVPGLRGPGIGQSNGVPGWFQHRPHHRLENLPATLGPYLQEKPYAICHGHGVEATPNAVSGSTQKKFIIFDHSGNHTRLFFSPHCSPSQNPIVPPTKSLNPFDFHERRQPAAKVEHIFPTEPIIEEKSDENQIIGEASEMHEDTEEINALLYSDDDGDDSEEDEVRSTGRSPFAICKKREQTEEITEEVSNSYGPMKRQRLIDGGYKKSSLMAVPSSAEPHRFFCKSDDDAESSCAKGRNQGDDQNSTIGTKQLKDKICETLKILENLIPGAARNDPVLLIEEAIGYLSYLKLKAMALGVG